MFLLHKIARAAQALAIISVSMVVKPSAACSWLSVSAYVQDENGKTTDWQGDQRQLRIPSCCLIADEKLQ